ncbi:hypothetical protein AVDCRST_MAG84-2826, partial [uncultured Microcoleus sp.]
GCLEYDLRNTLFDPLSTTLAVRGANPTGFAVRGAHPTGL